MKTGKLSPHYFMLIFCRRLKYVDIPAFKHNAVTLNGYVISCRFTPGTYGPQGWMSMTAKKKIFAFSFYPFRNTSYFALYKGIGEPQRRSPIRSLVYLPLLEDVLVSGGEDL